MYRNQSPGDDILNIVITSSWNFWRVAGHLHKEKEENKMRKVKRLDL